MPTFNFQELHKSFQPVGASLWALPPLAPLAPRIQKKNVVVQSPKTLSQQEFASSSEAAVMLSASSLSSAAAHNTSTGFNDESTGTRMLKASDPTVSLDSLDDLKAAQDQAARTPPDRLVGRRLCVQGLGFVRVLAFHRISRQACMQSVRSRALSGSNSRRSSSTAATSSDDSLHTLQVEAQSDANDLRASLEMLRSRPIECVLRRCKQGTWNSGLPFVFADNVIDDNDTLGDERGSDCESDTHEELVGHDSQPAVATNPIAMLQCRWDAQQLPPPPPSLEYIHPLHQSATSVEDTNDTHSEKSTVKGGSAASPLGVLSRGNASQRSSNSTTKDSISGMNSGKLVTSSNSADSARSDLPGWCHEYDVAKAGWLRLERADASNAAIGQTAAASARRSTLLGWISSHGGTASVSRYFTLVVPPPLSYLNSDDNTGNTGTGTSGIAHGETRVQATQPRIMYSKARDKPPKLDARHCTHLAVESADTPGDASPPDVMTTPAQSLVLPDPNDPRRFTVGKWGLLAANDEEAADWIRALHAVTTQHRVNCGHGGSAVDSWFVGGLSSRNIAAEDIMSSSDSPPGAPRSRTSTGTASMQRYRSLSATALTS